MYISKIRVKDYKSFRDSGEIEFKPGINLIVGQNNAGKTALLEAISLRFGNKLHRSEKAFQIGTKSAVGLTLSIESKELNELKLNPEFNTIILPQPLDGRIDDAISLFNNCFDSSFNVRAVFNSSPKDPVALSHELYKARTENTNNKNMKVHLSNTMNTYITKDVLDQIAGADIRATFGWKLIFPFKETIYRFDAERPNLGTSDSGDSGELNTNASNLAQAMLNTKAHNDVLYERFVKYVSEVTPSIKWVTSVPTQSGAINEIRIWSIDKKTERDDLAIPLSECSTGVGQILAILYVVVTSKKPRTIIIDEPNSFLHPGAAKKLVQILNKFPQHQYFISTHSPEILAAAKPSTITRLKYIDGETIAESINPEQTKDLRETLNEIGVKFSDVFFSENILWVEGKTEEKAFPLILETADKLFDVAVLPLVHTDDLRERKSKGRKHAELVFEIYKRLSGANALTPPLVAVILDKESSSPEEIKKLIETFGDKLKFIPRMMYESYLLDAEAITEVLNSEILEDENKVNIEQVENWIAEKREGKFLSGNNIGKEILEEKDWLENVHAADLLEKLFSELSNKTVEYRKTTHSVKLTEWLLENKPEQLAELKDFLLEILSTENSS